MLLADAAARISYYSPIRRGRAGGERHQQNVPFSAAGTKLGSGAGAALALRVALQVFPCRMRESARQAERIARMAKSPFPGMDPYLEHQWRDVHLSLIAFSRGQLNRQLKPPLCARAEERVYVETDDESSRQERSPDVYIVEHDPQSQSAPTASLTEVAVVESIVIQLATTTVKERFLEVIDVDSGEKVITVIEFLSPTNKRAGAGRDEYLSKRREYLDTDVNVVEIDLSRAGPRGAILPVRQLPANRRQAAYLACIRRASRPREAQMFPIPLSAKLPVLPIPLRKSDDEIHLDLQEVIERAYEEGHHDMGDYRRTLSPPLTGVDADFADKVLKQAGKR
ncbi:MAG: DUF4058 family protein [Pirellulaceae bacterium]|nr:DUF4058 family protein [Pirellulaceae bacterium]